MRDRIDEIRGRGAELVVVGNGSASFAEAFAEEFALDGPLLVDPELRAYRAAGLRRGLLETVSPRMLAHAVRALRGGSRQSGVQGDPWQLGGVFVIERGGSLVYAHRSREAGDHAPIDAILAALDGKPVTPGGGLESRLRRGLARALGCVVDPFVVGSFDRTGFRIHSLGFEADDLEVDLSGRRCLVTGANSGIGRATSLALAELGGEVVLLCRSRERGEEAVRDIRNRTGNRRVSLEVLDVSDLSDVRRVAARLGAAPVDVLVHNAGVLPDQRHETPDGLELAFATHVVGPFLLTALLRGALEKSADGRVVWVSSGGMYARRLNLADPNWRQRDYDGVTAYAETKRAQVVLSELWADALRGSSVVVNAMHPGWADTPAVRRSLPRFHRLTRAILRSAEEGADTVVWLAASPRARLSTGRFFFDRRARSTHRLPFTRESEAERQALWQLCERIAGGAGR